MADGGDAAGDPEILRAEHGAALDRTVDLGQTGLDPLGLGLDLPGPGVLVDLLDLDQAGLEPRDLRLLFVGGLAGPGMDAPEMRRRLPVDLDHGGGPLPAGRELVGEGAELGHGEAVEKDRIVEPDPALVVPGEEVAQHLTAGGLVVLDADETGNAGRARHPFVGQHALHLPCRGPVALARDLLPDRHLPGAVGGDGEGLEHVEVDLAGAVGVQQLRGDMAEAETLLDGAFRHAEARGDGGHRLAGIGELRKRDHLVGRVHGDADDVLGQRQLGGLDLAGPDLAVHGTVGVERAILDQRLHGLEAAPARDHGVGSVVIVGIGGADDEVLQQAEGGDRSLELGVGLRVGRGLADVLGREREAGKRDLPDERLGPGGDEVHGGLHGRLLACGAAGSRRPPPHPLPNRPPQPPDGVRQGIDDRDGPAALRNDRLSSGKAAGGRRAACLRGNCAGRLLGTQVRYAAAEIAAPRAMRAVRGRVRCASRGAPDRGVRRRACGRSAPGRGGHGSPGGPSIARQARGRDGAARAAGLPPARPRHRQARHRRSWEAASPFAPVVPFECRGPPNPPHGGPPSGRRRRRP